MLKQKERYKKVEYLKPLKEKLQVHVKLIKPIYLIKTQHYEGFDFDLNGVLDNMNCYLRKLLHACQKDVKRLYLSNIFTFYVLTKY